jgi:uncharacterized protein
MQSMTRLLLPLLAIVILAALAAYFWGMNRPGDKRSLVILRDQRFRVEIADNPMSRARGLSGRESLPEGTGMLFVFASSSRHGFWMKDMNFPIDILWFADDRLAGIEANVQPEPDKTMFGLTIYYPPEDVNRVLELPAGTAAKYGLEKGDRMRLEE